MNTRDIMTGTGALQTVRASETLADAARKMREHKVSALPVVDEGRRVVGMISERDVARQLEQEFKTEGIDKTLQLPFAGLTLESSTKDAGRLAQGLTVAGRTKVERLMTREVVKANEGDSIGTLVQQMTESKINHIPVLDGERLTGIVARRDVVSALSNLAKEQPAIF